MRCISLRVFFFFLMSLVLVWGTCLFYKITGNCSPLFSDVLSKSREVSLDQSSIWAHQELCTHPILFHASSALTQSLPHSRTWQSYQNPLSFTLHIQQNLLIPTSTPYLPNLSQLSPNSPCLGSSPHYPLAGRFNKDWSLAWFTM